MNLITKLKSLTFPSSAPAREIVPVKATISRRTFFSFFGTGVALLAKPDLLLPSPVRFGVTGSNVITNIQAPNLAAGLRYEFARVYARLYREQMDKLSFFKTMEKCSNIAPPLDAHSGEELYKFYIEECKPTSWERIDKLVSE